MRKDQLMIADETGQIAVACDKQYPAPFGEPWRPDDAPALLNLEPSPSRWCAPTSTTRT